MPRRQIKIYLSIYLSRSKAVMATGLSLSLSLSLSRLFRLTYRSLPLSPLRRTCRSTHCITRALHTLAPHLYLGRELQCTRATCSEGRMACTETVRRYYSASWLPKNCSLAALASPKILFKAAAGCLHPARHCCRLYLSCVRLHCTHDSHTLPFSR